MTFIALVPTNYSNVKQFGALGNGSTDDTASLQAALTAASGGGSVFIPSGTYIISADLLVPSNCLIIGAGRSSILKAAAGTNANVLNLTSVSHVTISDIVIDGNKANVAVLGIQYTHLSGIFLTLSDDITITRCYIHDCAVSGIMANGGCSNLMITQNRLVACYDNQIYIRAKDIAPYTICTNVTVSGNVCTGGSFSGVQGLGSTYITFANNVCTGNGPTMAQGDGVGSEGCSHITIASNVCANNGIQGVNVRGTTETGGNQISSYVTVTGNECSGQTSTNGDAGGISITDTDTIVVSGNLVYNNGFGINITDVLAQGANHCQIIGNVVRSSLNTGIRVSPSSGTDFILMDNTVTDSAQDNIYVTKPCIIQGGIYARAALNKEGIHFAAGSDRSMVIGSTIYDNQDNGILIDSPVANIEIRNCIFNNIVGTNQRRAVQEQTGAGPTRISYSRITNQSTNQYTFNHANSRYYDEQTQGIVQITANYTALLSDSLILVNQSAVLAITIPNPNGLNGQGLTIKDMGAANTYTITITAASGTIDGAASKTITTAYGVMRLTNNGNNWFTL